MIEIKPLQKGLSFGARVAGLTLELAAEDSVRVQIAALFEQAGVIVFEDVEQSDDMHVAISTIIGPLKEHPVASLQRIGGLPGVIQIRNEPNADGIVELDGKRLSHWLPWHFDHCYNDELNLGAVLRAVEIVPEGGITGFVDGVALYQAMPKELLAQIEGRDIIYTLNTQYETMRFGRRPHFNVISPKPAPPGFAEQAAAMPRALHPAVWTRASGEKVLHISPWMAEGISGDETTDGEILLEHICQEINRLAAQISYHHQWRHADMLIWDNRRVLHSVSGHDPAFGRTMNRTTISGDYGLGRFEGSATGGKILSETMV